MANRTLPSNVIMNFISVGSLPTQSGVITGTFQIYADHAIWDSTNNTYVYTWNMNPATSGNLYYPYGVFDE